ncbi:S46 family peptidase [Marinilabilia rubra]|uniref:Dipeptidyl-peptidase n=1 Tax=Marinilabilia rubra TaxID=2162893 RepID=A0A2U2B7S1_9BACT|nr:S46 family peptidase [Marinilabilia rubra]PWD99131.1 S46 family peptidase [Marinilabilia rubra]
MWKRALFLLFLHQFIFLSVQADEGMWLPWNLPQSQINQMQKMGLEISIDEIYSSQKASLKDAIVSLDNGSCTGSFISTRGLLLTNHHCAYGEIQEHSSVENDYLKKGFWAESLDDELPNPGKTATLLIEARNLTGIFNSALENVSGTEETLNTIDSLTSTILDTLRVGPDYDAQIKDFLFQNEFYLFITQTFKDVRLVGAPPEDIGQFGGEHDNWMWPRHSADFALFRVYTSPDGKPADYHPKNIPFHPSKVLDISTGGINKNDFTMTLGYPGSTDRYLTSTGIKETQNILNPLIADVRGIRQKIWEKNMRKSHATGIQYADKYASSYNFYKYAIGQNESIKELSLISRRQKQEQNFETWMDSIPEVEAKYNNVLTSNRLLYTMRKKLTKTTYITLESLINGPEIGSLVVNAFGLYSNVRREDGDPVKTIELIKDLESKAHKFFRDFSPDIDKKVFRAMLKYYQENLEDSLQITSEQLLGNSGNIRKLAKEIYEESAFSNPERFRQLLKNPKTKAFESDPAFAFYKRVFQDFGPVYSMFNRFDRQLDLSMHRYIKARQLHQPDKNFYPDANSTMRLSYGYVDGYSAPDGNEFPAFSSLKGLISKAESSKLHYQTQVSLESLFFKPGSNSPNINTPLCFISNNDITGGNSGSPVLNGNGEIIGLAFDGNWEGMASDLSYNSKYQRCVNADIRYVLFLIENLGQASHLIEEIKIAN